MQGEAACEGGEASLRCLRAMTTIQGWKTEFCEIFSTKSCKYMFMPVHAMYYVLNVRAENMLLFHFNQVRPFELGLDSISSEHQRRIPTPRVRERERERERV